MSASVLQHEQKKVKRFLEKQIDEDGDPETKKKKIVFHSKKLAILHD